MLHGKRFSCQHLPHPLPGHRRSRTTAHPPFRAPPPHRTRKITVVEPYAVSADPPWKPETPCVWTRPADHPDPPFPTM